MSVIQAFLIAGRTPEQKARLIAALTQATVSTLSVEPTTVRVIIKDIPNTEFGIGGANASSLGRGIGRGSQN